MFKITRSPRVEKLRDMVITTPAICVERAYYMTESYKETENMPSVLRRAYSFENVFNKMSVRIEEGELLAGWPTTKMRGGALLQEIHSIWVEPEVDTVQDREWERYEPLSDDEKDKILNYIMPYWKGKTMYEKWAGMVPKEYADMESVFVSTGGYVRNGQHQAHVAANYPHILENGLNGTIADLERRMKELDITVPGNLERYNFYKAAAILQRSVITFAERHADLAEKMAGEEKDAVRKKELLKMAETCRYVPANTPRTFYEAVQMILFIYCCVMNEGWGAGNSLGRPDQYLLEYYERDIANGVITREEAQEILELLLIKLNTAVCLGEGFFAVAWAGYPVMNGLTIGGVKKDGMDAVNELSYLFLDAEEQIGLTSEDIVVRFSRRNPEKFCLRAIEVAKNLKGKLKFIGDESMIQSMLYAGLPVEAARNYISTGCHNPSATAVSHDGDGQTMSFAQILEFALNNGVRRKDGVKYGIETGDPKQFASFEQILEAFQAQYENAVQIHFMYKYVDMKLLDEDGPCTLISSFLDSCLERGVDVYGVGTYPYASHTLGLTGAANVGDSLAAIKKVVFDDKKATMEELIDALDANFEGYDELHYLLSKAPKFGNNDEYVDGILRYVLGRVCDYNKQFKTYKGRQCGTNIFAMTANIPFGWNLGATPDGRKAWEPLAEGGISPHQGRNIKGLTATLNSVAHLDQIKLTNGSILNVRVSPGAVKDNASMIKFTRMIRSFFEDGGNLVQFNFTDNATLRAAQKEPEKYKDLLVRVATYSSYFVEISPQLQENIIQRNELE